MIAERRLYFQYLKYALNYVIHALNVLHYTVNHKMKHQGKNIEKMYLFPLLSPFVLLCIWFCLKFNIWLRGATVARLTPDQKVACSNHVGVKFPFWYSFLLSNLSLILNTYIFKGTKWIWEAIQRDDSD